MAKVKDLLLLGIALAFTGTNAAPAMEVLGLPSSTDATDQGRVSILLNGQTYINKVCISQIVASSTYI